MLALVVKRLRCEAQSFAAIDEAELRNVACGGPVRHQLHVECKVRRREERVERAGLAEKVKVDAVRAAQMRIARRRRREHKERRRRGAKRTGEHLSLAHVGADVNVELAAAAETGNSLDERDRVGPAVAEVHAEQLAVAARDNVAHGKVLGDTVEPGNCRFEGHRAAVARVGANHRRIGVEHETHGVLLAVAFDVKHLQTNRVGRNARRRLSAGGHKRSMCFSVEYKQFPVDEQASSPVAGVADGLTRSVPVSFGLLSMSLRVLGEHKRINIQCNHNLQLSDRRQRRHVDRSKLGIGTDCEPHSDTDQRGHVE